MFKRINNKQKLQTQKTHLITHEVAILFSHCYHFGFLNTKIMITEKEFQDALKIVNNYVLQLNSQTSELKDKLTKTTIDEFVIKHRDKIGKVKGCRRLLNLISSYKECYPYIEDILVEGKGNVHIRGFGNESWDVLQFLLSNQAE